MEDTKHNKIVFLAVPLMASAFGGAIGAYATQRAQEVRIETIERSVNTLLSTVSVLSVSTSKAAGVLEERGPRIELLQQQVTQINARLDRVMERDRSTR